MTSNRIASWTSRLALVPLPNIRAILWLAALFRLLCILLVRSFQHPQTWEFGPLAKSVAAGLGYSDLLPDGTRAPAVFMPPAYSYFLALFLRLMGDTAQTYFVIEVVQAACGVLSVYIVYKTAALLIGQRAGLAAAALAAIFPTQVYMCTEFHGISVYVVLGTAAVFFLIRYVSSTKSVVDAILAGLCMGAVMLFRAEAPGLVLLYSVILLIRCGRGALLSAIVFLVVAFGCLAPWTLRNYRSFDRLILVCASGGYNLWVGHNPRATGSQHYSYFDPMPTDIENLHRTIKVGRYNRVDFDQAMGRLAVQYIVTQPIHEVSLALKKLWLYFVFDTSHDKGRNPAYWLPSLLLTLLAVGGGRRRGIKLLGNDLFLLVSIGYSVAVSVAVFVLPRYKIVIDPFIMIVAANLFSQPASRCQLELGTVAMEGGAANLTVEQSSKHLPEENSAATGAVTERA